MRRVIHRVIASMIVWLVVGCGSIPMPAPQEPYLSSDGADGKTLQALIRKESQMVAKCGGKPTCDHVLFTRALTALYESRESAVQYFEKVVAVAPKSQLAVSSRLWIQLLRTGAAPADQSWWGAVMTGPDAARVQPLLSQAIERTVRDLLDRELTIQQLRALQDSDAQSLEVLQRELHDQERKAELFNSRRDGPRLSIESTTIQNLQRQLSERDRRVEELTGQLDALKRIDQEMRGKPRSIKPSPTLVPSQLTEPAKP